MKLAARKINIGNGYIYPSDQVARTRKAFLTYRADCEKISAKEVAELRTLEVYYRYEREVAATSYAALMG